MILSLGTAVVQFLVDAELVTNRQERRQNEGQNKFDLFKLSIFRDIAWA